MSPLRMTKLGSLTFTVVKVTDISSTILLVDKHLRSLCQQHFLENIHAIQKVPLG